jgi:transposase
MVVASGEGIPLGIHLDSAAPAEVNLIGRALDNVRVPGRRPLRLIADRGYDSQALRGQMAQRGIDLIAPHRPSRVSPKTQDGRKLRRYRRRWIIERTLAWLGNFRRLIVRHEHGIDIYRGFFHLACLIITLNRL